MTKVIIDDQQEVADVALLVPKSMTLDDLKGHYALCFKTHASFGAYHENLNEDRPILSATMMQPNVSSFQQYKDCADIRGGSLQDEASNDSGVIENVDFQGFGRYVFGTLGNEANVIIQYYLVPCRLSIDPKIRDLE